MFSRELKSLLWLAFVSCLLLPDAQAADKTDVVVFLNGDRLTGEVKRLERGRLSFNTDATDTIRIEWDDVAYLTSDQQLQVELEDGTRYLGNLGSSTQSQTLNLITRQGDVELVTERVVVLEPIESNIRERIDGDLTLGYNYTKASDVAQTNVGVDFAYRDEKRIVSADFNVALTTSANNESSERAVLSFSSVRLLRDRWVAGVLGSAERNDELGIDRRFSIGGGGGRFLRQTNRSSILLTGGLLLSQEQAAGSNETNEDLEGFGAITAEWFRYDEPELDFSTTLNVYPNLSDWGRVRADLDLRFKWEIVADLFWDVTLYNSYDSDPPAVDAEKNDFGVRTSVGWEF